MTDATMHPLAPHVIPGYLAGDSSDPLFVAVVVLLIGGLLLVGNLYFKLHALPEHLAHRRNATQSHAVAVLALLALLTHNNVFWIAALLMAVVELPDYATPLNAMANSLDKLSVQAGGADAGSAAQDPHEVPTAATNAGPADTAQRSEC